MDSKMFGNVKYEKEKAMERFNKFQKIKKKFKFFEIVFVLLLLSWSTKKIPGADRFQEKVFEISVYFSNPHFVFLIGNAIIFALFLLCRAGNSPGDGALFKEYPLSEASKPVAEVPVSSPAVEVRVAEDNVVAEDVKSLKCAEVEVVIAAAEKKIMRFQRTFSEKLKTEITVRPRKELRRSETENGRSVNGGDGGGGGGGRRAERPSFKKVEHLTNEEFKLAIDAFIDKHRVFSKEPIIEELSFK